MIMNIPPRQIVSPIDTPLPSVIVSVVDSVVAPQSTITSIVGPVPLPQDTAQSTAQNTILSPQDTAVLPQSTATPLSNTGIPPTSTVSSSRDSTTGNGKPAKTGISAGAVAGATIGGIVVGAFVAAILVFFLLQRRQNRTMPHRHARSLHKRQPKSEKIPIVQTSVVGTVDEFLPQVIDDDAVKTEVSRISDNIRNHVRTYYHSNGTEFEHVKTLRLELLETATGIPSSTLVAALVDPSTRTHTLRLFIAWSILSRVGPESPSNLLPAVLSPLANSLADNVEKDTASITLFSKWKVITGVLLQQSQGKQGVPQQALAEALADLDRVLSPFVSAGSDRLQRHRNLEMILNRAANLSLLLFSQPGSYRFDFADSKGRLTVFPELLQTLDSGAKPLVPPKVIWAKETLETGEVRRAAPADIEA